MKISGIAIKPKIPAVSGVRIAETIIQTIQKPSQATLKKIDW